MRLTRLEKAQIRLQRQREWIESCGGDLAGYIARYGDPGICAAGAGFMFGDGGTLIWQADAAVLRICEEEYREAKLNHTPRQTLRADEYNRRNCLD